MARVVGRGWDVVAVPAVTLPGQALEGFHSVQSPPLLMIARNIPSNPGPLWTALSNIPNAACVLVMLHAPVSPSFGVGPGAAAATPPDRTRPTSTSENTTVPRRKSPDTLASCRRTQPGMDARTPDLSRLLRLKGPVNGLPVATSLCLICLETTMSGTSRASSVVAYQCRSMWGLSPMPTPTPPLRRLSRTASGLTVSVSAAIRSDSHWGTTIARLPDPESGAHHQQPTQLVG